MGPSSGKRAPSAIEVCVGAGPKGRRGLGTAASEDTSTCWGETQFETARTGEQPKEEASVAALANLHKASAKEATNRKVLNEASKVLLVCAPKKQHTDQSASQQG